MKIFNIVILLLLILSFLINRKKTLCALKKSLQMFINILPSLLVILMLMSLILIIVPHNSLEKLLGENSGFWGYIFAATLGSIALIPGFVAYPMASVLIDNGVSYPVISIFITTLMMVGIVTFPIEKKYFGWKVALVRNTLYFLGALFIGTMMSLMWSLI